MPHLTDDELIDAMFAPDRELAAISRRIWEARRALAAEPEPREPKHCPQCFEGCPACEGARRG